MTVKYTKVPQYPEVEILGATAGNLVGGEGMIDEWESCVLTEKAGFSRDSVVVDRDGNIGYQLLSVSKPDKPIKVFVKMIGGFKSAAFAELGGELWDAADPLLSAECRMVFFWRGEFIAQLHFLEKLRRRMCEAYPECGDICTLVDENDRRVVLCEIVHGDEPMA